MKIAVIGVGGFVGSHIVRHLSARGHTVVGYGRTSDSPLGFEKFGEYREWDITQPPRTVSDADAVIHAAGYVDFWGDYREVWETNVSSLKNVISFASQAKQFVYISTANVYGPYEKKEVSESDEYDRRQGNVYAHTKRAAEKYIWEHAQNKSIGILRPHAVYGPGDRTLAPRILEKIRSGAFYVPGGGFSKISVTHVGNICEAVSVLLSSFGEGKEIFNVADSRSVTFKDVLARLFQSISLNVRIVSIPQRAAWIMGGLAELWALVTRSRPFLSRDLVNQTCHESTVSIKKITALGYSAPYDLDSGLQDFAPWIDSLGGVERYLESPKETVWKGRYCTY